MKKSVGHFRERHALLVASRRDDLETLFSAAFYFKAVSLLFYFFSSLSGFQRRDDKKLQQENVPSKPAPLFSR